ncbi:mediator complex, subunit Med8 [Macrophomina phaseolina]|uniref:Mediator of RNA polymerase II transcription subunit 8 n=1 Tax=Macrophomina phaseolina TaxID=35725 RepID=A0ABQ8GKV3_9PEZI|nr:mediator complex, subunit Med8 [Macrophomina phaseolina]
MSARAPTAPAPPDEVRSLDLLAQRLQHLNGAIEVLKNTQAQYAWDPNPPPWTTIAHQSQIINGRFAALLEAFKDSQQLLNQAHPYPLPNFPGRTHENMVTQLTRKKMVPWAEDWIADGVKHAAGPDADIKGEVANSKLAGEGGMTGQQMDQLWDWAGPAGGRIGKEVLTGEVEEEEEGEDEDEDEEDDDEGAMEGVEDTGVDKKTETAPPIRPMMPLEDILKFVSTGVAP